MGEGESEVEVEEVQRVGQKKFIRKGWKGRLAVHKGGLLAASLDHKQLFEGLDAVRQKAGYDQIKTPSKEVTDEVFMRLRSKSKTNNIREGSNLKVANNQPKNQILYGPPGTGKTYHTIDNALKIIDPDFYTNHHKDRNKVKQKFDELLENKRIGFVTFHQSFSYEDFVEGLKAEAEGGQLSYTNEPGVFKTICEKANISGDDSLDHLEKALEELKEKVSEEPKELETARGNKFEFTYNGKTTFRVIPSSSSKIFGSDGDYSGYAVGIDSIRELYKNSEHSTYNLSYAKAILDSLSLAKYTPSLKKVPHVLIIDEINRGNISRIFGELITLIEPSKRAGEKEEISVTLPYSKKIFSVPSNLYIIGTMNTADRSLALMDTALRRRFDFVEMMPDVGLVDGFFDDVNVSEILKVINKRIEVIYDREHTIGHAFLMGVNNLNDLRNAFKNKILPLLEEYFYEDWKKIQLILGDINNRFYEPVTYEEDLFSGMENDVDKNEVYRRKEVPLSADSYIQIYKGLGGSES